MTLKIELDATQPEIAAIALERFANTIRAGDAGPNGKGVVATNCYCCDDGYELRWDNCEQPLPDAVDNTEMRDDRERWN